MAVLAILIISNVLSDYPPYIAVDRLAQALGVCLDDISLPLWYGEVDAVVGSCYISVDTTLLIFADFSLFIFHWTPPIYIYYSTNRYLCK